MNLETYQATIAGRVMDLTYMEYELLRFLATNPHRVFTRETLLSRVWGYEYYGGARTVDVHVRRLRAKLGEEHAHLIQTVRSVGYKFGVDRRPRGLGGRVGPELDLGARAEGELVDRDRRCVPGAARSKVATQTSLQAAKSAMSTRKSVALKTSVEGGAGLGEDGAGVHEGLAQLVGRGAVDELGTLVAGHETELARDHDDVARAPPGRVGADRGSHATS